MPVGSIKSRAVRVEFAPRGRLRDERELSPLFRPQNQVTSRHGGNPFRMMSTELGLRLARSGAEPGRDAASVEATQCCWLGSVGTDSPTRLLFPKRILSVFSIQCGSCRAKLKVAKVELIGQSLACPRCGSMVQVEPPPGWTPPIDSTPASTRELPPAQQPVAKRRRDQPAPLAPRPEDLQETLPNVGSLGWGEELKLADIEPGAATGAAKNAAAGSVADRAPKQTANAQKQPAPGTTEKPGTKEKSMPDALLRPENWDSAKTRRRRTLLLAMIGSLGLLLLFGTLGYYLWEQRSRLAELEKAPPNPPADGSPDKTDPAKNTTTDGNDATDGQATDQNPVAPDPQNPAPKNPDPDKPDPGNTEPSPAPSGPSDPPVNPQGNTATDPIDPDLGNPPLGNPGADNPPGTDGTGPTSELPGVGSNEDFSADGGFQDVMDKIFEDGLSSEWDDPRFREMTQATVDPIDDVLRTFAQNQTSRSRSPRVAKPLPREVDTRRGLTAKVAGFRQEQGRVASLMAIAETLSGLPVWLDIQRFEGQPRSLSESRLIEAVQSTIPDLLTNELAPFGFTVDQHAWNPERPEFVGLRVFPTGSDKMTVATYAIEWLDTELPADSIQAELQKVAPFLTNYVGRGQWSDWVADAATNPEAQSATGFGAWQIQDGKIVVVHFPHVHVKLTRLIKQLTLAKANQGQPVNWPDELLPRAVQESGRLQTVINILNHQPTPLRQIFQQIQQQTDVTVVVDWPSLIADGWTPDTVVPVVAENKVLSEVLDGLSLDMELSLRHLSPDVVCLLSDSAEERFSDVEVYPVGDLCPSSREWPILRGRLMRLLEQDIQRYPSAYLYYDPDFRAIVAWMPQSSHRRLHAYFRAARRP